MISLDLLKQLVEMDSQVNNVEGIKKVQLYLLSFLSEMKFSCQLIDNPSYASAPLLFASKIGNKKAKTVTFIGHSDVVTSPKTNPFRILDDKVMGSGVADDKGGLFVCLTALMKFFANNPHHDLNINVVISPSEETGSLGFHHLFKRWGQASDFIFGLEPALQDGSLITSRSGNRWYKIQVNGISAHAGRFGFSHVNAAHQLGQIIAGLQKLNSEKQKRRANVGSIQGGNGGFNTICGQASALVDVRFSTFKCRENIHSKILSLIEGSQLNCPYTGKKAHTFFAIEDDCPPLMSPQLDCEWYETYRSLISSFEGRMIFGQHAGGAADINYFASPKKFLLDGMGPVGGGLHTPNEYVEKASLFTRAEALSQLLTRINDKKKSIVKTRQHFSAALEKELSNDIRSI